MRQVELLAAEGPRPIKSPELQLSTADQEPSYKASSGLDLEHLLCSLAEAQDVVVVVMSYDGGTIMIEFTKHSSAACNGQRLGYLEVDAGPNFDTRVAERLAIEAEFGSVDCEEQGREFG